MNRIADSLHPTEELSGYLDGDLAPALRAKIETHLRSCTECGTVLEELRAVTVQARHLPDLPLERDLWAGIEERITAASADRPREVVVSRPGGWWGRRFSFSMPQLAAACLALVALSGGAMWLGLRAATPRLGDESAAIVSSVPLTRAQGAATDVGLAAETGGGESLASLDPARYDAAIADLQSLLAQNRGRLDPATVRTVETDLAIIDRAIDQARRALIADPSSAYLNGHLAEQLRRKMQVLRRTTDAVTADFTASNL